jgi:hypothetical protein
MSVLLFIQYMGGCRTSETSSIGVGERCESDSDCRPGLVCPVEDTSATSFGLNQCSFPCTTDEDCPTTQCYSCDTDSVRPVCLNWGCS